MGTIFSAILAALCLAESFRNLKQGLVLFLLSLLFAPYMVIGSKHIRIELLLTPLLAGILLVRYDIRSLRIPYSVWPLLALWGYTFAITLISVILGLTSSPAWLNAYAYLRPVILVFLFANVGFSSSDLVRILRWFAASAIPLSLLAIGQTFNLPLAAEITINSYVSPGRPVIERMMEELGFILRAVSVFETPAYAATYFLSTLVTSIYLLFELRGKMAEQRSFVMLLLSLVASLVGGALTLSATFVAGISFLLFLLFLRLTWHNKVRAILLSLTLGACVFGYLILIGKEEKYASIANNITYQIRRVVTLELFETRYAEHTGYLSITMKEIGDNPLVGYGWTKKRGVFIGDSMYVVLLYQSGIVGFMIFLWWITMTYRTVKSNPPSREMFIFWLSTLLVSGMGSPSFFIPRLNDWWWSLCGIGISLASLDTLSKTETPT